MHTEKHSQTHWQQSVFTWTLIGGNYNTYIRIKSNNKIAHSYRFKRPRAIILWIAHLCLSAWLAQSNACWCCWLEMCYTCWKNQNHIQIFRYVKTDIFRLVKKKNRHVSIVQPVRPEKIALNDCQTDLETGPVMSLSVKWRLMTNILLSLFSDECIRLNWIYLKFRLTDIYWETWSRIWMLLTISGKKPNRAKLIIIIIKLIMD